MCEKTVIDEGGCVKIPSIIRARTGWLKKTDITVTAYSDGIIMMSSASGDKLEDAIKKTQAVLKLEESFKAMRAKNFDVSDEEIAGEIKEYRKAKRKTG